MKKLVLVCLLLSVNFAFAQHEGDVWVFGDSCGIKFDSIPHFFQTSIYSGEANASIADKDGNLLYYAGAPSPWSAPPQLTLYVWDSTNAIVPNGNIISGEGSNTQGALLLPDPADTNSILLFSTIEDLRYSKINKSTNSVDSANIFLCDSITEKLCAIRHANGRDWWVFTHQDFSNTFIKILVSVNGVSLQPIQHIGYSINNSGFYSAGQMVFSPQGNKLCFANLTGMIELFDFDRCNGMLSNPIHLADTFVNVWPIPYSYYGASFSPDGSKLYVSRWDSLFQFDLNAGNIIQSRTLIARQAKDSVYFGQHLLAPDGKIYIASWTNPLYSNAIENSSLDAINFPDSLGAQCDINLYSFSLNGYHSLLGLPNIPNYKLGVDSGSVCDTITGSPPSPKGRENVIWVYPNPAINELAIGKGQLANGQEVTFTIYDLLGKMQLQQTVTPQGDFTIAVKGIPIGIYFLQVKQGDKVYNAKFVKE